MAGSRSDGRIASRTSSLLLIVLRHGTHSLAQLYQTKQAPPVPAGIELSGLADDFRLKCFAA